MRRRWLFAGLGSFLVTLVLFLTLLLPAVDPRYGIFNIYQKRTSLEPLGADWLVIDSGELNSFCGEEMGYELGNALDGGGSWAHIGDENHCFILDLGSAYTLTQFRGRSLNDYDPTSVDVYVSNDTGDWGAAVGSGISSWQDTDTWQTEDTTDKCGRYIKVEATACEGGDLRSFMWGGTDPYFTIFDGYGDIWVSSEDPPVNSNPYPTNNSVNQDITPKLSITINDQDGDTMNVTFRTNVTGTWGRIGYNASVTNGTYRWTNLSMDDYSKKYWWSTNTTDDTGLWDNDTYCFTTEAISTTVNTISPYEQSSSPLTITVDGPSDLSNVTLYYRYSSINDSVMYYTDVTEEDIITGAANGLDYPNTVDVADGYAFVASYSHDVISVFNVTDPSNIVQTDEVSDGVYTADAHACVVTNDSDYCYVLTTTPTVYLSMYDASDKTTLTRVNQTSVNTSNGYYMVISEDDNYLFVTTQSYLYVYNITDKTNHQMSNMSRIVVKNTSSVCWLPSLYSEDGFDYIYIPSGVVTAMAPNNGLIVYNITDKSHPPVYTNTINQSTICTAAAQIHQHDNGFWYLFYAGRTRLYSAPTEAICMIAVYNISAGNASHPSYMYSLNITADYGTNGTSGWGVFQNDYLYLNTNNWHYTGSPDWQNGFFVYNFTDIDNGDNEDRMYGKGSPTYLDYTHFFAKDKHDITDTTVYTVTQDDDSLISLMTTWDEHFGGGWVQFSTPDTTSPWSFSFTFSNGTGYYQFYSIGKKTGSPAETAPSLKDALCHYTSSSSTWHTISSSINGSVKNITVWKNTVPACEVNGSIKNISAWTVFSSSINGSIKNLSVWKDIVPVCPINGSIKNITHWSSIIPECPINGSIKNISAWIVFSSSFNGSIKNLTYWTAFSTSLNGSIKNITIWRGIIPSCEVNGSIKNISLGSWGDVTVSINGSIKNLTYWVGFSTNINGSIKNITIWKGIIPPCEINGSIKNISAWIVISSSLNGSIKNITSWTAIITNINGSIKNITAWRGIVPPCEVNGSINNITVWDVIDNAFNGSIKNLTTWQVISSNINGSIKNITDSWSTDLILNGLTDTWNVTWSGEIPTGSMNVRPVFCNSSGDENTTVELDITVNSTAWVDTIYFWSIWLNNTVFNKKIFVDNVTVWVSIDNVTWAVLLDDVGYGRGRFQPSGGYLVWNFTTSPPGCLPFSYIHGGFYVATNMTVYARYQLNITQSTYRGVYYNQSGSDWQISISNVSGGAGGGVIDTEHHTCKAEIDSVWRATVPACEVNGSIKNISAWIVFDSSFNGSIKNITYWYAFNTSVNGSIKNLSGVEWVVISSSFNGSIKNITSWIVINTSLNGSIKNVTIWKSIIPECTINGSIKNISIGSWSVISSSFHGAIHNGTWYEVNITINGTIKNISLFDITISSISPVNNSVGVCPCCEPMCVVFNATDYVNMTVYIKSVNETVFVLIQNYTNITSGEYCWLMDGYLVNNIYQALHFNETYDWYVNISVVDEPSFFNNSTVFHFTTAVDEVLCSVSGGGGGGGGGGNSGRIGIVGLVGVIGVIFWVINRRRKQRAEFR